MATRKSKPPQAQPPPPPPRILNLPRRATRSKPQVRHHRRASDLGVLIDADRREDSGADVGWKIQAEILQAECEFLRVERELAVKKMEKNRERMEVFLKSAMENLGREKIDGKEMDMMDKRTHPHHDHHHHVEMLRRRMEVVEEYSQMLLEGDWNSKVKGGCSYCKEVMRRVLEQVRAETDHWNEMQKMVEKVRVEMEELQVSRDLWRRRASSAELNLRLVHAKMLEWQWRAQASESKLIELKKEREETNKSSGNSGENQKPGSTHRLKTMKENKKEKREENKTEKREFSRRPRPLQEIGNLR